MESLLWVILGIGLLLVSLMARQLRQAVKRSQQRFRELQQLEQLGRAILNAPPDASQLPTLLQEYTPLMFPDSQIEIRFFPDEVILHHPGDWPLVADPLWDWLSQASVASYFLPGTTLPWNNQPADKPLIVAPLRHVATAAPVGGIYIAPRRANATALANLSPAVQSLAAQISSALHSARVYRQTLAHQRIEQELALAGEIQASFLPVELPRVSGWQLVGTLKAARETAGDFYDVISLPNGRLAIIIADVADKGIGAALFMALSRTLLRTYAVEYHTRPDFVMRVANNRILMDSQAGMFVTVFYGVLDPRTGRLSYCNAGHNPPYLFGATKKGETKKLTRTGIPLGVLRGETWEQRTVQLDPGELLLLYTDGVVEAQNKEQTFFGNERMLAVAQRHLGQPVPEIQAALMETIYDFMGDAPQFDDIALMLIAREV